MKTSKFIILSFALSFLLLLGGSCKAIKGSEKINQADSIAYVVAKTIIPDQNFLISVNRVVIMNTTIPSVSPTTNFILVNGEEGVVQLSPAYGGGPNGVGGFTVKGSVTDYKYKLLNNGDIYIQFHINAPVGSCDVQATITRNTGKAIAYVHSTFRRGRTTMYGEVHIVDGNYFQGRSPF